MPLTAPALSFSSTVFGDMRKGVLVVTLDNPPVNATSTDLRIGLMAALAQAAKDEAVEAVVVTGAGKIFVGGADIREFGKPPVEPTLPDVMTRLERLDKPVVAALNGAALGGGLEVALACHHRIAVAAAKLALPEVKLGLVPGAGGTQRLPRLTGVAVAVDLIGSGRTVTADEGLSLGMIDAIAGASLQDDAVDAARALIGQPVRRTGDLAVPTTPQATIEAAVAKIRAKARGQLAPLAAMRLVLCAAEKSLAEGLADERSTFLHLRDSDEAKALRHVFLAERAATNVEGLEHVIPRPVAIIGIVGTGLMGCGIAVAALDGGYRVIGVEQTAEAAGKGLDRMTGLLERNLRSGRIDAAGLAERLGRLVVTEDAGRLVDADLVIEAVFDDLAVKTSLFQRLDSIVRPDAILATNTSYLDPDVIAAATVHPDRVIGLHFFSPANIMRLLEVVRGADTAPDVLATGLAVARRLGKLPVVTGVCEGFIGNRIFSAYRREAEFLVEDGALPQDVDAALESYGFAMGLFAVCDLAGLEIAWARRKRQAAGRDPAARYVDIADRLCEAGRFGQKTGKGWYAYPDGRKSIDPDVTDLIEAARAAKGIIARTVPADEIVTRLLKSMCDEGVALLSEGIAARAGDIDLVMINGYGFPAHKGGPMFAASIGDHAG